MKLRERISARMDNAYIKYIDLCQRTECLGADKKMELGEFSRKELEAHKEAERQYGKHTAFVEVLKMIDEEQP